MPISCCACGVQIEANDMNMCTACIASEVNVAEGITTSCELVQCQGCLRFQSRGKSQKNSSNFTGAWVTCDWESKELMSLCLKNIPGLHKAKILDAGFIWTEPHSKRVKLRVKLQREVDHHAVVRNWCMVTFVIHTIKCPDCAKQFRDNTWRALVQVRQKAEYKYTFLRLEQAIIKNEAHREAIDITAEKEGMDFYFGTKAAAERFVRFISTHAPARSKSSSKMISSNIHNATANVQTTHCVELSPICKDDLVILPKKLAQSCGNISTVVICARTTAMLHFLDPVSGQKTELTSEKYWKAPFLPPAPSTTMVNFVVLDVEPVDLVRRVNPISTKGQGRNSKYLIADVEVARESDFGVNDTTFQVRSHLGAVLTAGDVVKGYDLSSAVFGCSHANHFNGELRDLPDVVLVRKAYPRKDFKGDHKLETLGAKRNGKVSKTEAARMEREMEVFAEEYLDELDEGQDFDDEDSDAIAEEEQLREVEVAVEEQVGSMVLA